MSKYDIGIIGGGPAGLSCAVYAARGGKSVAVFESQIPGGKLTSIPMIENYIGFDNGIDGFSLAEHMRSQAERFGAVIIAEGVKQLRLNDNEKLIITDSGEHSVSAVIVASGGKHRELGVVNEKELVGYGVSYCATCDGMLYRNKDVVVVGGGNSAFTSALYLAGIARNVYIVHRSDSFRATKVLIDRVRSLRNTSLITSAVIKRILGSKTEYVTGIEYESNGELHELHADGVFVNVGNEPNIDFLHGLLETDENKRIITDEHMETSVRGVFAAGDVRRSPLYQVVTAVSDGATAAERAIAFLNNR